MNIPQHSDNLSYFMYIISTCDPWQGWVFVQSLHGIIVAVSAASGCDFFVDT